MEDTRPPTGASPTQPYKCGQNVKVKIKVKVKTNAVLTNVEINTLADAEIKTLTLTLNILTALKGWVGLAPVGGRVSSILLFLFDFLLFDFDLVF